MKWGLVVRSGLGLATTDGCINVAFRQQQQQRGRTNNDFRLLFLPNMRLTRFLRYALWLQLLIYFVSAKYEYTTHVSSRIVSVFVRLCACNVFPFLPFLAACNVM